MYTHSEVDTCNSIQNDEDVGVGQFLEAEVQTSCKENHHK